MDSSLSFNVAREDKHRQLGVAANSILEEQSRWHEADNIDRGRAQGGKVRYLEPRPSEKTDQSNQFLEGMFVPFIKSVYIVDAPEAETSVPKPRLPTE